MKLSKSVLGGIFLLLVDIRASSSDDAAQNDGPQTAVFSNPDLGYNIIAHTDPQNLDALSLISKDMFNAVDHAMTLRYLFDRQVYWALLFWDMTRCTFEQRRPLIRFIMKNHPSTANGVSSGKIIEFLDLIKRPNFESSPLPTIPYIPHHLEFWDGLMAYKIIGQAPFPIEAFIYESPEAIAPYIKGRLNFNEVKDLFESEIEEAISDFCAVFPGTAIVDGETKPIMTWDNLDEGSNIFLAVYHHKYSDHEALMKHLLTYGPERIEPYQARRTRSLTHMLMNSYLSTEDILELVGQELTFDEIFNYPLRVIDILSISYLNDERLDIQEMQREDFIGTYSAEIQKSIEPHQFYQIALLAGASEELLKMAVQDHPTIAKYLICPAMASDMAVVFVGFLASIILNYELVEQLPMDFRIPSDYYVCLIQNGLSNAVLANMTALTPHWEEYRQQFRVALRSLDSEQLSKFLFTIPTSLSDSVTIMIYYELIKLLDVHTRDLIESYLKNVWSKDRNFRIALFGQSPRRLAKAANLLADGSLRSSILKAYYAKEAYLRDIPEY